jgi:serine/threonine-protein kinase PknK
MRDLPARYEPQRRLGAGGGGEVWSVRDRATGQILALKVLASGAGEPEVSALVREAVALSGLEGLGVPRVVAFGALPDGRRYMVRDLVEGQSLEEILRGSDGSNGESAAKRDGERGRKAESSRKPDSSRKAESSRKADSSRKAESPRKNGALRGRGDARDAHRAPIWLEAIASACDQLTVVHRAGLLHGDIKPANIIVDETGRGTLVDLGLAAPWREGGTAAQGLTPKYAAPELLAGEPLTVRAEVYAIGATLGEALALKKASLSAVVREALSVVARRATEASSDVRFPSVDELASALRLAAGLPPGAPNELPPWPVLGLEFAAQSLLGAVRAMPHGATLAVFGPKGAGKTTLARRLAWTLGAEGRDVSFIDAPRSGIAMGDVVELELSQQAARGRVVIVDDTEELDTAALTALAEAARQGARLVAVSTGEEPLGIGVGTPTPFAVPRLETEFATELLRRAIPSLPDALRTYIIERTAHRPGPLRAAVRRLAGKAIVSIEDVDAALAGSRPSTPPTGSGRARALAEVARSLDRGRFGEAASLLDALGPPQSEGEQVHMAFGRARIALDRADAEGAFAILDAIEQAAERAHLGRMLHTLRARADLRAGRYRAAAEQAEQVLSGDRSDALAANALSIRGVALAYTGEDDEAHKTLDEAVRVARALGEPRMEAVAFGSLAIAHQRAGRMREAREGYEVSLAAAERAEDAATVATTRLNLAGLARAEGELGQALAHFEAAADMAARAGTQAAVTQALLNLANLDLYLGRWARARGSLDQLAARRHELAPFARAQLLGLEAEHAARTSESTNAASLYEEAARVWEAQGRPQDAAESRLEGLLARARARGLETSLSGGDAQALSRELEAIRTGLGEGGFGEHTALAELVRGAITSRAGNEEGARRALDLAVDAARKAGRSEWAWQALDARARLSAAQGAPATARRDTEAALAMLEETASKLPRDLREVFWDDPRRRSLQKAHAATASPPSVRAAGVAAVPAGSSVTLRAAGGTTSLFTGLPAEDRLARLLEITRELASEHDMERLLARVTDNAVALLGAERGFVLLIDDAGRLQAHTARNRVGGDDPHANFSRSVAELVLQSNEPVLTASARDDARLAQAVSVHQLMIQSIACVPIRGVAPAGRTIGALYVETRMRPGVRFEQELPTLRAFADQAAIAIENARLLAENRARADELAHANDDLATARDDLARALGKRTEQLAEARRDLKQVRNELRSHFGYGGLVGLSTAMRRVYALIERVKDTDVALLVTGESGTGKEMIARAVHQAGPRAKKPFLGLNCGAIPANLLESELFGSVKGAFTGADRARPGLFQEAHEGTLLLDEIGEMPAKMQAGLLRVLQEKRVRPVGGTREDAVDVRVIAATHRDLGQMVAEGTFREDLYYRLHVIELHAPALRERVDDIPLLIDHFISRFSTRYRRERKALSRGALRKLCSFPWPGNVRQLEHVLLSAWLMTDGSEIEESDLELPVFAARPSSPDVTRASGAPAASRPARVESKKDHKAAERERILSALTASNWNRAQAAQRLGVPRRTFYRRLKEYGLL